MCRKWWRMFVFSVALAAGCSRTYAGPTTTPTVVAAAHGELAWAAWHEDTFARARSENRIILINVVATWCHWCHVMEEETYADPEIAGLLTEHFTTIKVDSDARPDVAERYRAWGWPATAILSPDAQPILELRGFQNPEKFKALLLELIAERDAGKLARREQSRDQLRPTDAGIEEIRTRTTAQLDDYYDEKLGGWGMQQKYPFPEPVEHAFARAVGRDQTVWRERALKTLKNEQKIIDPVWGGIYQYSVGGDWEHPHYEKITAIQAGAILNFAQANRVTGDDMWLEPARLVARYMTEFMRSPDGGFYTSQDADFRPEGGEAILGKDYYSKPDAERRALGEPRIDKAVYADLNGHMIAAFAELYAATGDPEALASATRANELLKRTHRTKEGAFKHGEDDDDAGLLYLRDQAAMGRALLALYRATGDRVYREDAKKVGDFIVANLQDSEHGGFFAHTEDPAAVGVFAERRKPLEENGLAARFLVSLHRYLDGDGTQKTPYFEAATRSLRALGDAKGLHREGRIVGGYLMAAESVSLPTVDVTVVGSLDDETTRRLYSAALRYYDPRAVLELSPPGERYPDIGKPAVYLCTDTACSTPVTKPETFAPLAEAFLESSLPPVKG